MDKSWTSDSERTRQRALEIVRSLLHDWVKYMEMRLLSIDWRAEPTDAARQLNRAIRETRRQGSVVRGVREIWDAGRADLLALDSEEAARLVGELDDDVAVLEELLTLDATQFSQRAAQIDEISRRPGVRLRSARDLLRELRGGRDS